MPSGAHVKHHAVVLYNGKDIELARELVDELRRKELEIWFADDRVSYGKLIWTEINAAVSATKSVLIAVGPSGLYDTSRQNKLAYMGDIELSSLLSPMQNKELDIIPICLGAESDFGPGNMPNLLLNATKGIDMRHGIVRSEELDKLVAQLKRNGPRGPEDPPPPPVGPDDLAGSIAALLQGRGLSVGIGAHWHGEARAESQEIALDILGKALSLDAKTLKRYRYAPHIGPEAAAAALALIKFPLLERPGQEMVRNFIAPKTVGEPEAFLELADLMAAVGLQSKQRRIQRAVTFTTNVDAALERAFLRRSVPFVHIVFDLAKQEFHRTEFPAAQRRGDAIVLAGPKGELRTSVRADLTGRALVETSEKYADWLKRHPSRAGTKAPDLDVYLRTREMNSICSRFIDEAGEVLKRLPPSTDVERPVIVKLLGCQLIPETAALGQDEYIAFARLADSISAAIGEIAASNVTIFTGYCLCDASFNLLHKVVFNQSSEGGAPHYALLPEVQADDGSARLRKAVQSKVAGRQTKLGMDLNLRVDPAALFSTLRAEVNQFKSAW